MILNAIRGILTPTKSSSPSDAIQANLKVHKNRPYDMRSLLSF